MKAVPTRVFLFGSAFAVSFAAGLSCKYDDKNEDHCVRKEGDAYCVEKHGEERGFCGGSCVDSEDNDGCVEEAPSDPSCYSPCGDDKYADEDDSCLDTSTMTETNASTMDSSGDPSGDPTTMDDSSSVTMTMTGDETETDPTETTGPTDCQVSEDCTDPNRPVCLDNDCVPCTETPDGDMACNAKDEALPVCRDDGHCVQCTGGNAAACGDMTPVCDDGTSTCVGCTYHEQCAATACDIATGACFDDGCVIDVEDGESIGAAVANECVLIVHAGAFAESVQISGEKVAILAAEGDSPTVAGEVADGQPAFNISGGAVVYIQGLRVNGNDGSGLGIDVDGSTLYIDRTEVVANSGGGINLTNAAVGWIRSSIVGANGGSSFTGLFGVSADESTLTIEGSTVALNDTQGAAPASLLCNGGTVTVRNSIIVAEAVPSISCDGDFSYSAVDTDVGGATNVVLDTFDFGWFDSLGPGGFHLGASGDAFEDIALVEAGDYPFDFDGDPRPAAGAMDHAGADTP